MAMDSRVTVIGSARTASRMHSRTQVLIPKSLMALLLAELQIALITHWLASAAPVEPHNLAKALLINTHAVLAGGACSLQPKIWLIARLNGRTCGRRSLV